MQAEPPSHMLLSLLLPGGHPWDLWVFSKVRETVSSLQIQIVRTTLLWRSSGLNRRCSITMQREELRPFAPYSVSHSHPFIANKTERKPCHPSFALMMCSPKSIRVMLRHKHQGEKNFMSKQTLKGNVETWLPLSHQLWVLT